MSAISAKASNGANKKNGKNKNDKSEETKKALSDFKSGIIESTKKIIKEYLPIKIVQLSELFEEMNNKQTEIENLKYQMDNIDISINNNTYNKQNTTTTTNTKLAPKENSNNKKPNKRKRSFSEMTFDDKDNNKTSKKGNKNKNKNKNNKNTEQEETNKMDIIQEKELKNNIYCDNNSEIDSFTDLIRKEVEELIDYLDQIGLFINLHIPKIEDGNNFGVQIQEQMKGMVSGGQVSAQDFLRNVPKFHTLRAKLISKIMKYPNLEDYKRCVIELDYKQMLMLKHCLRDLRNNYWILYDVLNKNWDKIIKPKGDKNTTFSMY